MQDDAKDGPSMDTNKAQPINTARTPLFRWSSTVAVATVLIESNYFDRDYSPF
jgi:hypothetical protein